MSRPENDADEDTSLWAKAPKVARTYHKVPCVIAYRRRGGEVGGGMNDDQGRQRRGGGHIRGSKWGGHLVVLGVHRGTDRG